MKQYHEALQYVLDNGEVCSDRTGVGTRSVFGYQMRFDLNEGFPAVTTKKLAWKAVVGELLWFLEGSTDERRLAETTGRLLDTSTMSSPKSLAQSMERSGVTSTTQVSTRSQMSLHRYKTLLTQEELSFRHGILYNSPKWHYRPVTYSRSFGLLTVS